MGNQNVQKFNIGDRVWYNSKLYKILHIRDNGDLKLQSVRGKSDEIFFCIPQEFVRKDGIK